MSQAALAATLPVFDSHFHIIDRRFPLVENQGFLPDDFTCADYRKRASHLNLVGGAIVSGSFQALDQGYLLDALATLGPAFVGVTQLPAMVSDGELLLLDEAGVRAVRFNVKRGGSEGLEHLEEMAHRVYDLVGWHVELYIDARDLGELRATLLRLPAVSIDHLGLSAHGLPTLLKLAEQGVRIKATGFGRVDFDVKSALQQIAAANPAALMFGTDLPSTRAPRPYLDEDLLTLFDALGEDLARKALAENALEFYQPKQRS
jgi:predicted TIM-barrel fold metal-dependent hydrolase